MTDKKAKETVQYLKELHRPLEEHWSLRSNYVLNSKQSDYIYKFHISHLEDIYMDNRPSHADYYNNIKEVQRYVSPVAQLYGANGLLSKISKDKEKEKEQKWIQNFQKFHKLTGDTKEILQVDPNEKMFRPKVNNVHTLPPEAKNKFPSNTHQHQQNSAQPTTSISIINEYLEKQNDKQLAKRRYVNNSNIAQDNQGNSTGLPRHELTMLGMYSFTEEQERIYKQFVQLLSQFNRFDMESIVKDALIDADSDDILDEYTGVDNLYFSS